MGACRLDSWEPRTDEEMLRNFLLQAEGEHLDFKLCLDLESAEGKVKFAKDVVALANTHPGGHLVVGVDNSGSIPDIGQKLDPKQYDSARLRDAVSKYVEGSINIRAQIHNLDGSDVLLIAITSGSTYPIPMSKQGDYTNSYGKQCQAFRSGDVYLREGSQNVSLRYGHWERLLALHDRQIHDEARRTIESIVKELAKLQINGSGSAINIPLSLDMSYGSLGVAIASQLTNGNKVSVERLIRQALNADDSQWERSLTVIAIAAVRALEYSDSGLVSLAVDCLFEMHERPTSIVNRRLEVIVFLYVIGAAAVRYKRWTTLLPMVLRGGSGRSYRSWIRETQVDASTSGLFSGQSGMMIDLARGLMANIPELRPDIRGELPLDDLPMTDAALKSLCQFDFIQVLVQEFVPERGRSEGYPACASYSDERVKPFINEYIRKAEVRADLTHQDDESKSRNAFASAHSLAQKASSTLGFWCFNSSQEVDQYLEASDD